MFEKILLATTASPTCDDATNVAFDLAKKYNSELTVFHVLGVPTRGFSPFFTDVRTGETESLYDENYLALVKEEMQHTYEKQLQDLPSAQLVAVTGVPSTEILRRARQEDSDLIVMGSHTRQYEDLGASRFRGVAGSTMQKVTKSARCPVLIISRPCTTCWWYFSNIVVGVDFSKASLSAFLFALKAAREIPCRLHIFHAVDLSRHDVPQEEIESRVAAARKKLEEMYLTHLGGFDAYEVDVWEGTPHVEILKYSRTKEADLIVMAHHTREIDPEKALLGSTVEQVVLRASCPVASVNKLDKVEDQSLGKISMAAEPDKTGKVILGVDDEMHMRIFITTLFETSGYRPVVSRDGRDGMKKARELKPDLIILDVMMPGEGGTPMYRQLKTDPELKHIPVIMLSAVEGATFAHSLKVLGAGSGQALPEPDGYMEKPPNPDELLRMARRLMGESSP